MVHCIEHSRTGLIFLETENQSHELAIMMFLLKLTYIGIPKCLPSKVFSDLSSHDYVVTARSTLPIRHYNTCTQPQRNVLYIVSKHRVYLSSIICWVCA